MISLEGEGCVQASLSAEPCTRPPGPVRLIAFSPLFPQPAVPMFLPTHHLLYIWETHANPQHWGILPWYPITHTCGSWRQVWVLVTSLPSTLPSSYPLQVCDRSINEGQFLISLRSHLMLPSEMTRLTPPKTVHLALVLTPLFRFPHQKFLPLSKCMNTEGTKSKQIRGAMCRAIKPSQFPTWGLPHFPSLVSVSWVPLTHWEIGWEEKGAWLHSQPDTWDIFQLGWLPVRGACFPWWDAIDLQVFFHVQPLCWVGQGFVEYVLPHLCFQLLQLTAAWAKRLAKVTRRLVCGEHSGTETSCSLQCPCHSTCNPVTP